MQTISVLKHRNPNKPAIDRSYVGGGIQGFNNITELKAFPVSKRSILMIVNINHYDTSNESATTGGALVSMQYRGQDTLNATWQNLSNWYYVLTSATGTIDSSYLSNNSYIVKLNSSPTFTVDLKQQYAAQNVFEQYRVGNTIDSVISSQQSYANNVSGVKVMYAKIESEIADNTTGVHDGRISIYVAKDGTITKMVITDNTGVNVLGDIKMNGVSINNQGSLPVFYKAGTGQIAALTANTTPANDDLFLIELAAGGFRKIRADILADISNIPKLTAATVQFENTLLAKQLKSKTPSANTDITFLGVNASGTTTFSVTGDGDITAKSINVTSMLKVNGSQISTSSLSDASAILKNNQANVFAGYLQTIQRANDQQLKLERTDQANGFGYLGANGTYAVMIMNNAGVVAFKVYQDKSASFESDLQIIGKTLIGDANTKIYKDSSNNLVFEDVVTGAKTLAQLVAGATSGNVVGPASSTDWAVPAYDSTTGKLLRNTMLIADVLGNLTVTKLKVIDSNTYLGRDASNNLVLVDAVTGTKTLASLASALLPTDVHDTPVNNVVNRPISSNWAYDHLSISNPHGITKSIIGLGNVENTALSTWLGTANITTLGTIGTGIWQGSVIAIAYGGTGANNAQGAIDNLTNVIAATNEWILTKDTATGNAKFKALSVPSGHISYDRVGTDLKGATTSAPPWDFSSAGIIRHTMTTNTTASFTNYKLNKSVIVEISGNYALDLSSPKLKKLKGSQTYSGTGKNWINFLCVDDTAGSEVVLYNIMQEA